MTFGFWDNTDITWLEQQLSRFTYKPGWKMAIRSPLSEWDEPMLMVQFEAQDTYNPSRTIPIGSRDTVPYHIVRGKNEDRFADWLQHALFRLEQHESMEWLRRDGSIYKDPHKERM